MSFVNHFNKYNKWYSFILLLVVTLLVALLFIRVEQLDIEVSKQLNTPVIDKVQHSKTVKMMEKKKMEDAAMMEDGEEGAMMEGCDAMMKKDSSAQ